MDYTATIKLYATRQSTEPDALETAIFAKGDTLDLLSSDDLLKVECLNRGETLELVIDYATALVRVTLEAQTQAQVARVTEDTVQPG